MSVLNHLGQVAAVLLLLELMVVLLIFLGIFGGLGFGLHWVRGKTDWAFGKVNHYVGIGVRGIHQGTGYAVKPLILAVSFLDSVGSTVGALKGSVRAPHNRQNMVAARPVPEIMTGDTTAAPVDIP